MKTQTKNKKMKTLRLSSIVATCLLALTAFSYASTTPTGYGCQRLFNLAKIHGTFYLNNRPFTSQMNGSNQIKLYSSHEPGTPAADQTDPQWYYITCTQQVGEGVLTGKFIDSEPFATKTYTLQQGSKVLVPTKTGPGAMSIITNDSLFGNTTINVALPYVPAS